MIDPGTVGKGDVVKGKVVASSAGQGAVEERSESRGEARPTVGTVRFACPIHGGIRATVPVTDNEGRILKHVKIQVDEKGLTIAIGGRGVHVSDNKSAATNGHLGLYYAIV